MESLQNAIKNTISDGKKHGVSLEATFIPIVINIRKMGPAGLSLFTNDSIKTIATLCKEDPYVIRRAIDSAKVISRSDHLYGLAKTPVDKDAVLELARSCALEQLQEESVLDVNAINAITAVSEQLFGHKLYGESDTVKAIAPLKKL